MGMSWARRSCSILDLSSLDSSSNRFSDLANSSPAGLSGSGLAMVQPPLHLNLETSEDVPSIVTAQPKARGRLHGRRRNAKRAGDLSHGRLFRFAHLGSAEAKEATFRPGLGNGFGDPGKPD